MLASSATFRGAPIAGPAPFPASQQPASPSLEKIAFQHIQDTSSKRISTLDYLRKAYVQAPMKILRSCC
jgi:hypothetical protein